MEYDWLLETTGLNGQSKVRRINPATFVVEASVDLESQYFGEGSTCYMDADGNPRLITLTWQEQTGFIYDPLTLERLREYRYFTTPPGNEGWGITYDVTNREFIVSDGSSVLYFWDRDTLEEKRKVTVTRFNGNEQYQLNELEYMDGLICCNIWHSEEIICVDPVTGKSVREYGKMALSCELHVWTHTYER
jgi:glutamine cyclotransferase